MSVLHLRPRPLRLAALTVTRRWSVTVAAALTVTSGTIAPTMVTRTIGLMRLQPTAQCTGFIDRFMLMQGISQGTEFTGLSIGLWHSECIDRFIGLMHSRCIVRFTGRLRLQCIGHFIGRLRLQRTGHFIDALRSGADASCASCACFA